MSSFNAKINDIKYLLRIGANILSSKISYGKYIIYLDGEEDYEFNKEEKEKVDLILKLTGQII